MKNFHDLQDLVNEIQIGKIELENLKQNLFKSYFKNLFSGEISMLIDERKYVKYALLNVQRNLEAMEDYITKVTTFSAYSLGFFLANVMSEEELVNISVWPIDMNRQMVLKDDLFSGQETHYVVGDDEVVLILRDLFSRKQWVSFTSIKNALQKKKYVFLENKDNYLVYDYLNSGEIDIDFDKKNLSYLNQAILCLINWRIRHPFYETSPGDDLYGGLQDYLKKRLDYKDLIRKREKSDSLENL